MIGTDEPTQAPTTGTFTGIPGDVFKFAGNRVTIVAGVVSILIESTGEIDREHKTRVSSKGARSPRRRRFRRS